MQATFDDHHLRIGGLTIPLSRHVILSVICRCARLAARLKSRAAPWGRR